MTSTSKNANAPRKLPRYVKRQKEAQAKLDEARQEMRRALSPRGRPRPTPEQKAARAALAREVNDAEDVLRECNQKADYAHHAHNRILNAVREATQVVLETILEDVRGRPTQPFVTLDPDRKVQLQAHLKVVAPLLASLEASLDSRKALNQTLDMLALDHDKVDKVYREKFNRLAAMA